MKRFNLGLEFGLGSEFGVHKGYLDTDFIRVGDVIHFPHNNKMVISLSNEIIETAHMIGKRIAITSYPVKEEIAQLYQYGYIDAKLITRRNKRFGTIYEQLYAGGKLIN